MTPLFDAVVSGDAARVRALLASGADPNAREDGDNATPLHLAAANGQLDVVRALLDGGADVHGHGDLHDGDVIGWAAGDPANATNGVIALLRERGARHHIFSAIALDDAEAIRDVVRRDPAQLSRRRSRFEHGQTPLHFALASPEGLSKKTPQYAAARLLIELGADVNAVDARGRTPLETAMLHGDLEAARLLIAAGAVEPDVPSEPGDAELDALRSATSCVVPMLCVEDVDAAVAWYVSLGWMIVERAPETGAIAWAMLSLGDVRMMVQPIVKRAGPLVALWFFTTRVDDVYAMYRARQLRAAKAALAGTASAGAAFTEDLYEPPYGGRQFSVRDPNGFELVFRAS